MNIVRTMRAHHAREMFLFYLEEGDITRDFLYDEGKKHLEYVVEFPIMISDTVDDICGFCRSYPAINFYRGPKLKKEDIISAGKLGLDIGREYSDSELLLIFSEKAKEHGLEVGNIHDVNMLRKTLFGQESRNAY